MAKLYLLDKDGTLTETLSGNVCANKRDDQIILPNVKERLQKLKDEGHHMGVISNQGGVSWGFMSEMEAWAIMERCNQMLDGVIANFQVNFYHEKAHTKTRWKNKAKPAPDMIIHALQDFKKAGLNFDEVHFVGDGFSDKETAENFNATQKSESSSKYDNDFIQFHWSHDFFGWEADDVVENSFGYRWKREYILAMIQGTWNGYTKKEEQETMF